MYLDGVKQTIKRKISNIWLIPSAVYMETYFLLPWVKMLDSPRVIIDFTSQLGTT